MSASDLHGLCIHVHKSTLRHIHIYTQVQMKPKGDQSQWQKMLRELQMCARQNQLCSSFKLQLTYRE